MKCGFNTSRLRVCERQFISRTALTDSVACTKRSNVHRQEYIARSSMEKFTSFILQRVVSIDCREVSNKLVASLVDCT